MSTSKRKKNRLQVVDASGGVLGSVGRPETTSKPLSQKNRRSDRCGRSRTIAAQDVSSSPYSRSQRGTFESSPGLKNRGSPRARALRRNRNGKRVSPGDSLGTKSNAIESEQRRRKEAQNHTRKRERNEQNPKSKLAESNSPSSGQIINLASDDEDNSIKPGTMSLDSFLGQELLDETGPEEDTKPKARGPKNRSQRKEAPSERDQPKEYPPSISNQSNENKTDQVSSECNGDMGPPVRKRRRTADRDVHYSAIKECGSTSVSADYVNRDASKSNRDQSRKAKNAPYCKSEQEVVDLATSEEEGDDKLDSKKPADCVTKSLKGPPVPISASELDKFLKKNCTEDDYEKDFIAEHPNHEVDSANQQRSPVKAPFQFKKRPSYGSFKKIVETPKDLDVNDETVCVQNNIRQDSDNYVSASQLLRQPKRHSRVEDQHNCKSLATTIRTSKSDSNSVDLVNEGEGADAENDVFSNTLRGAFNAKSPIISNSSEDLSGHDSDEMSRGTRELVHNQEEACSNLDSASPISDQSSPRGDHSSPDNVVQSCVEDGSVKQDYVQNLLETCHDQKLGDLKNSQVEPKDDVVNPDYVRRLLETCNDKQLGDLKEAADIFKSDSSESQSTQHYTRLRKCKPPVHSLTVNNSVWLTPFVQIL